MKKENKEKEKKKLLRLNKQNCDFSNSVLLSKHATTNNNSC